MLTAATSLASTAVACKDQPFVELLQPLVEFLQPVHIIAALGVAFDQPSATGVAAAIASTEASIATASMP